MVGHLILTPRVGQGSRRPTGLPTAAAIRGRHAAHRDRVCAPTAVASSRSSGCRGVRRRRRGGGAHGTRARRRDRYVVALAPLLELSGAAPRPSRPDRRRQRARARPHGVGLPGAGATRLLAVVACPRVVAARHPADEARHVRRRCGKRRWLSRSARRRRAEAAEGGGASPLDAFVAARTKMRLDFVRRRAQRPVLLVRVGEGDDPGTTLLLRGMAYDRLAEDERGIPAWTRSSVVTADDRTVGPDTAEAEWIWLGFDPPGRPPVRHVIRDLQGHAGGQLFCPRARDVRFDGAYPARGASADGVVLGLGRLPAGAGYEVDAPGPRQARRPTPASRSDAAVAPLASYVASPPDAARLRAIAKGIVGDATAPSDRADRIEAWLRGLTYSKDMPQVDPRHPLVDFLTRVRAGHCEWFASSMAALLRSLGHPTRLVVGFRGGDFLATIGWVSFRGSHAHAWCETWFEGLGWVPYDPTPAAAGEVATGLEDPARAGAGTGGDEASTDAEGTPFWEGLLRFSREDRRRLAGDAGARGPRTVGLERTVDRWVPGRAGSRGPPRSRWRSRPGLPRVEAAVGAVRPRRVGDGRRSRAAGRSLPAGPVRPHGHRAASQGLAHARGARAPRRRGPVPRGAGPRHPHDPARARAVRRAAPGPGGAGRGRGRRRRRRARRS
jgi:hypothetical protein